MNLFIFQISISNNQVDVEFFFFQMSISNTQKLILPNTWETLKKVP